METFLWVEKYRPRSISECILPEDLKNTFSEFVKDKHIPNLILCGSAGVGKTTVAKAMLDEIGATSMMIMVLRSLVLMSLELKSKTLHLLYPLRVVENISYLTRQTI